MTTWPRWPAAYARRCGCRSRLRTDRGEIAASGQPPPELRTVPLTYRAERVGELVVGVRRGERRLSEADMAVLNLLATPLAVAVHATALAEELQASRERLVGAVEEERRRLRRELHDSLGPALTGAAFKVQATGNYIGSDATRAAQLNAELGDQVRAGARDQQALTLYTDLGMPQADQVRAYLDAVDTTDSPKRRAESR